MLGLPHTRTEQLFSHCAYSGKIRRFGPMMAAMGYDVLHYGVGTPDSSGWAETIEILTPAEQIELLGYDPGQPATSKFIGDAANTGNPVYQTFNERARDALAARVADDDIICLPFGHGHGQAVEPFKHLTMETGIGYPTCVSGYRIYESYAWLHWHLGRDRRDAWVSEWVVPNYFDPAEWPLRTQPLADSEYVLYFGRITPVKGLNVVWNLAKSRPDLKFVICGQGDATPWLTEPNIEYLPPVHGIERAALLAGARCVILPTVYPEPFGGVAVEAQLCGTPVLTSDHGAFPENNPCLDCRPHTEAEWLAGLDRVLLKSPKALRDRAVQQYSMWNVGARYNRIFRAVPSLRRHGWHSGPVTP